MGKVVKHPLVNTNKVLSDNSLAFSDYSWLIMTRRTPSELWRGSPDDVQPVNRDSSMGHLCNNIRAPMGASQMTQHVKSLAVWT